MDDTTSLSYWLNWRFFICASLVLVAITTAVILITKYEIFNKKKNQRLHDELDVEPIGILFEDETWNTSFKAIHPVWLLGYRLISFIVLSAILTSNLAIGGIGVFFFYTQWTFALVILYFGLSSSLSIYGCYQYWNEVGDSSIRHVDLKERLVSHMPPKRSTHGEIHHRKTAGIWGYSCQIIFQVCAGAVGLTDSVFWFIIYPFLVPATYKLNFLNVSLHSLNIVFLLIDLMMNRLRFPFFRLAYFGLWTSIFVFSQWILHACVSIRWPYSFLDLSSPYAPIWYLGVGLIHLPAFGILALIVKWKQLLLSRLAPPTDELLY